MLSFLLSSTTKDYKCSGWVSGDKIKKVFNSETLFYEEIKARLGDHIHKRHL